MSDDAKRLNIRWRRILFGAHLLIWLAARLVAGSLPEVPAGTYEGFWVWGVLVFGHWLLLSTQEARERVELPFGLLNRLIVARERRWLLLVIDVMLWFMSEAGVAGLLFSSYYGYLLTRYETQVALIWLLQTILVVLHLALVSYAEIHDRAARKRKNDEKSKAAAPLLAADGELIDFPMEAERTLKAKHER